jgi:hypothetical protein
MDWQPESEFVIPQPAEEVHYVWDPPPSPKETVLGDRGGLFAKKGGEWKLSEFDAPMSRKGRVASELLLRPRWEKRFDGEFDKCREWETRGKGGFEVPRSIPDLDAY